jgi:hypothetical protein
MSALPPVMDSRARCSPCIFRACMRSSNSAHMLVLGVISACVTEGVRPPQSTCMNQHIPTIRLQVRLLCHGLWKIHKCVTVRHVRADAEANLGVIECRKPRTPVIPAAIVAKCQRVSSALAKVSCTAPQRRLIPGTHVVSAFMRYVMLFSLVWMYSLQWSA